MKKMLIALLIAIVSVPVFAQQATKVVYDYKASIKRLDFALALKAYNKKQYVVQSFKTASDTINGFIIVPDCKPCAQNSGSMMGITDGIGYFWRSGDKLGKNTNGLYYVAKDDAVRVDAAQFGAYAAGSESFNYDGKKKGDAINANKYAWMQVVYKLGTNGDKVSSQVALLKNKNVSAEDVEYAFLGYANVDGGYVINNGFGTVTTTQIYCQKGGIGVCEDKDDKYVYEAIVNSITGTICGGAVTLDKASPYVFTDPQYLGPCAVTPMWDICDSTKAGVVNDAVISGTWTLKYNKSMTSKYNDASSEAAKEKVILDKIGVSSAKVFDVNK